MQPRRSAPDESVRWLRSSPDGAAWTFRVGRVHDDLIAEWLGVGVLRSNRTGTTYRFEPHLGVEPALAAKFHEGHVQALLRHLRGELTLHGSVVAIRGEAVALVGDSGAGKSTLAAALCKRPGVALVADDTAAVSIDSHGSVAVSPTQVVHWLTDRAVDALGFVTEQSSLKIPVAPSVAALGAARLRAIVVLVFEEGVPTPRVEALKGMRAFRPLSDSSFRFVVDEPATTLADLDFLSRVIRTTTIVRLVRAKRWSDLSATADAVEACLRRVDHAV